LSGNPKKTLEEIIWSPHLLKDSIAGLKHCYPIENCLIHPTVARELLVGQELWPIAFVLDLAFIYDIDAICQLQG